MNLEGDKIRCEALFNDTDSDCPISIDNDEKQEYKMQTSTLHMLLVK